MTFGHAHKIIYFSFLDTFRLINHWLVPTKRTTIVSGTSILSPNEAACPELKCPEFQDHVPSEKECRCVPKLPCFRRFGARAERLAITTPVGAQVSAVDTTVHLHRTLPSCCIDCAPPAVPGQQVLTWKNLMILQATLPAFQETVTFQPMSVVTLMRPTDKSETPQARAVRQSRHASRNRTDTRPVRADGACR